MELKRMSITDYNAMVKEIDSLSDEERDKRSKLNYIKITNG